MIDSFGELVPLGDEALVLEKGIGIDCVGTALSVNLLSSEQQGYTACLQLEGLFCYFENSCGFSGAVWISKPYICIPIWKETLQERQALW